MNQLILGDCLEVMKKMDSESVELIYLDPPFFSNRNYEVIWGDKGEIRSFEDRWSGGIDHYIGWLKERVSEMHRLLKPTGSIYLHCDYHADAEIKVYILNKIFGENNFRNRICWCYRKWSINQKQYVSNHDSIYFYTKTKNNTFNVQFVPPGEGTMKRWKGKKHKRVMIGGVEKTIEVDEPIQTPASDWWEIGILNANSNERIGYPTQKPEKLLDRIIQASSNEGDIVFDPFVGGGTTVVVADKLNRKWIGIDQSVQAVKVSEMRLNNNQNLFSPPFTVLLHKYDYDTLRYKDAFEFEKWIVEQFGGLTNIKQRSDLGLDGKTREGTPIQVKRSDNIGRNVVDNFGSACKRYDNNLFEKNKAAAEPVGFIIAFSFGKGAIQEVARLKNEENIIIRLVTVEEIVPIAKKPRMTVQIDDLGNDAKGLRLIEFTAAGESESGIEFYSWDFDFVEEEKIFKAEILLDKAGKQSWKFKPGTHTIAVKAIDNEGLEAIEIIKIKVNGAVERE